MENLKSFQIEPLRNMVSVSAVKARSARLWIRSERPGILRLRWWKMGDQENAQEGYIEIEYENKNDNTRSVELPLTVDNLFLEPLTWYVYEVKNVADDQLIGVGSFETAPDHPDQTPHRFSIALMSCNQPFNEDGSVRLESIQMLRAAKRCMRRHDTKFVLMVGDQMYSDHPQNLSLFNPKYFSLIAPKGNKNILEYKSESIRKILQRRYRYFCNLADLKVIHTEYPCYPIWDDHDIVDNWGSDPNHQNPQWQEFFKGAKLSCFDYQASRVMASQKELPDSFDYSFTYGNIALFVLDLRSNRKAGRNGKLFSENQHIKIKQFLKTHRKKKVLFFVLSVPVIHLPRFLAKLAAKITYSGEDFSDRWSSGAHVQDRNRFLETIYQHQLKHPSQKIILLSGDIHIGCVHRIKWEKEGPNIYQVVSSPITHINSFFVQFFSKLLIRANRKISINNGLLSAKVNFLKGIKNYRKNPYGGLNLGLIEIKTPQSGVDPEVRFYIYGHQGEEPVCVYCSPYV
ncbi:Phosphodiesterase/alkaline phosphatase D-like protein [Nitrosococcus halophilus Nc 4]|uniref:Phosphodiesterase/alkaline phosphatase D-like protein n=1 Tax=Nitrosococcus halophilus (strain Nc4) TaxID=472759 RepID=D5C4L9_NITHN|nr:alkaline phosphatase D family protein [Nitrosococcus halophilus]ADE15203.1 Phosphodiesterase/alkaline phosphatase D-like protein [Nitrosococcus halophilus Nc 4]